MNKLIISFLIASFASTTMCFGQTYVVRYQSFLDKDNNELERYDTYKPSKPDLIVLVQIDAAIMSIKVGNSYLVNTYRLSEIKRIDGTVEGIDTYTFKATDSRNNGVQTFTLLTHKTEKQAILERVYSASLIEKERLSLIEIERNNMSLLELYR